jgi:hypothetical protein
MNKLTQLIILIGCIVCPNYLLGQSAGAIRPDTPQAQAFFKHLQQLLKDDDRSGISHLVKYPLITELHGKKISIRNRTIFIRNFNAIFSAGIRCAIFGSTENDLWADGHGFTVDYAGKFGSIWFDGVRAPNESNYTYRLIAVNSSSMYKCSAP